jgi:hypothetical protein
MMRCRCSSENEARGGTEKLAIFGTRRAQRGAELKVPPGLRAGTQQYS